MNEFSQMIELVKQELLRGDAQMEVLGAYPQQLRARPQRQKLAVVAIQKVLMQPLGMQSFYGEEDQPLGRQAQVWMKIASAVRAGRSAGGCGKGVRSDCCSPISWEPSRSSAAKRCGRRTGAAWCCR